jgi:hypothetical protein
MKLEADRTRAKGTNGQAAGRWIRGKLIGQKPPLKLREVWSIRIRLQRRDHLRDLATFNLAVDSKLRGCDLVAMRVDDVLLSGRVTPGPALCRKDWPTGRLASASSQWRIGPVAWKVIPPTGTGR